MRLLDRYIIKSFLVNYLLALGVLLGIYFLLDVIINFDKFTPKDANSPTGIMLLFRMLADMADYYFYQSFLFFQLVSPAIPTLAAGFTMVRMTRHNELTAMLASGVSLYRIAAPIILCAIGLSAAVVVNQELVIPRMADKLLRSHDETHTSVTRNDPLYFVKDGDNSLLIALQYLPDEKPPRMTDVRIVKRDAEGMPIGRIMASEAEWVEDVKEHGVSQGGTWRLPNARQIDDFSKDPTAAVAEKVSEITLPGTRLSPQQLDFIYSKKAVEFLPSSEVTRLSQHSPEANRPAYQKIMNIRVTQPIMNLIMLLLGIPFLLTREPGRLVVNMFYCMVVSAICFVATFVFFQMSGSVPLQIGSWTFASYLFAWVPVIVFFPVSFYMLTLIKT